jgi:hypothetical protein
MSEHAGRIVVADVPEAVRLLEAVQGAHGYAQRSSVHTS